MTRPALDALAARLGIEASYESALDRRRVDVSESTLVALIAALGHDASSEHSARAALERLAQQRERRAIEPLRVIEPGAPASRHVPIRVVGGDAAPSPDACAAVLETESGERIALAAEAPADASASLALRLPEPLEPGIHALELRLPDGEREMTHRQVLVVAPERAYDVATALGGAPGFGLYANLWAVRGRHGLGHGDLGDLRDLARLAARHGASFVGLNPIHAGTHAPGQNSPYAPLDRLHRDPLYLEIEAIPELEDCPGVRGVLASAEAEALRGAAALDRARVWRIKRAALAELFARFQRSHARGATTRGRAFEAARAAGGSALRDYATFVALAEWHVARGAAGVDPWDWRTWPAELHAPDGPAVARFRESQREAIELHYWLQWELDRQLAAVAEQARSAGLTLGFCADLALGSRPGGVETWRDRSLFVTGVEAGAPPDAYAPEGQTWGFPPLDPARLVDGEGHCAWLALLRTALAHAGALRLDHVLSLHRLFWVPEGMAPAAGAYVRYPERALFGLLALESRRRRVVLIGEDLGTVPEGFSERLRERGLLSTRLVYFERDETGWRPADRYARQALVSANTHDLPPLAGWCDGTDIELRRRIAPPSARVDWRRAREEREAERAALEQRLHADGHLPPDAGLSAETAAPATARLLGATPSLLVSMSLDDLAGEHMPVNLPGVPEDVHASWTLRLAKPLAEIEADPLARACLRAMSESGRARSADAEPPGDPPAPAAD